MYTAFLDQLNQKNKNVGNEPGCHVSDLPSNCSMLEFGNHGSSSTLWIHRQRRRPKEANLPRTNLLQRHLGLVTGLCHAWSLRCKQGGEDQEESLEGYREAWTLGFQLRIKTRSDAHQLSGVTPPQSQQSLVLAGGTLRRRQKFIVSAQNEELLGLVGSAVMPVVVGIIARRLGTRK